MALKPIATSASSASRAAWRASCASMNLSRIANEGKAVESHPNRLDVEIALKSGCSVVTDRSGLRTFRARLFQAFEHNVAKGALWRGPAWHHLAVHNQAKERIGGPAWQGRCSNLADRSPSRTRGRRPRNQPRDLRPPLSGRRLAALN
jgi:hypothetical protein